MIASKCEVQTAFLQKQEQQMLEKRVRMVLLSTQMQLKGPGY